MTLANLSLSGTAIPCVNDRLIICDSGFETMCDIDFRIFFTDVVVSNWLFAIHLLDHFLFRQLDPGRTSCAHKWGQYTPALITTHLIQKYPIDLYFG